MNIAALKFVPVAILGAGVLLISGMREQYVMPPKEPIAALPARFADLTGKDTVVSEDERRIAGMSDYVMRQFRRDSSMAFTVYVGYYDRQVQGKTIHSPKNCLPGAGWDVLASKRVAIAAGAIAGTVNRVMLANKGSHVLVYYWYQGRGRVEANEYRVKWDLLRDAALFGRTEEALVRIVVPVVRVAGEKEASSVAEMRADSLARRIADELVPSVQRLMPEMPGRADR